MKRTNLRSNPDDAAHFKKHREATFHQLWAGESPEKAAADLVAQGVPSETAHRIVRALQQELALGEGREEHSRKALWWALGLGVPFLATSIAYGWFMIQRSGPSFLNLLTTFGPLVMTGLLAVGAKRKNGGF